MCIFNTTDLESCGYNCGNSSIIKIDKSFIDAINHDAKGRVLLENIIHLAHGFDLAVIAEGIENEDQLKVLQDMQCDMFQGYYFGKPMGKDDFESTLLGSSGH